MPATKLTAYVSKTRAWLASAVGKAVFRESRERFGYSYQRALCVAVMAATRLVIYERIAEVVAVLMAERVAA